MLLRAVLAAVAIIAAGRWASRWSRARRNGTVIDGREEAARWEGEGGATHPASQEEIAPDPVAAAGGATPRA